jgi:hypothetical protein
MKACSLLFLLPMLLVACGPRDPLADYENAQMVRKKDLSEPWPFRADSVIVHCDSYDKYLVTIPGGDTYALNPAAKATGQYKALESIWLPDTAKGGPWRVSIGPILDIAEKNCED